MGTTTPYPILLQTWVFNKYPCTSWSMKCRYLMAMASEECHQQKTSLVTPAICWSRYDMRRPQSIPVAFAYHAHFLHAFNAHEQFILFGGTGHELWPAPKLNCTLSTFYPNIGRGRPNIAIVAVSHMFWDVKMHAPPLCHAKWPSYVAKCKSAMLSRM